MTSATRVDNPSPKPIQIMLYFLTNGEGLLSSNQGNPVGFTEDREMGYDDMEYDFDELDDDEFSYDPYVAPDPKEWLDMDEQLRIEFIRRYHVLSGDALELEDEMLHAAVHTIVENQLAMGIPAVHEALNNLMAEGLDRHDALHAIADVVVRYLIETMNRADKGEGFPAEEYYQALREQTVEKWMKGE